MDSVEIVVCGVYEIPKAVAATVNGDVGAAVAVVIGGNGCVIRQSEVSRSECVVSRLQNVPVGTATNRDVGGSVAVIVGWNWKVD